MDYEVVIGAEIHAQLKTKSKAFCNCSTDFGTSTNTNVCPVCLGMPGALPVLNKKVVEMAILTGLTLNCQIQPYSVFSRKNYFYPDLPKGYQISQFDLPICLKGYLDIEVEEQNKRIGITRIHIEEDAGKLLHQGSDSITNATYSLVDLNRSSVPLIEIVSEPDIRSAKEARIYAENLRTILRYLDVCDGNLEEGSLRIDINVSLKLPQEKQFGTRTEVKNINSFRGLEKAIEAEVKRQSEILRSGKRVIQETRNYDDATQSTTSLRSKEEAHDYRYFPEPDLLPLLINKNLINSLKQKIPELPQAKKERFSKQFSLSEYECNTLISDFEKNNYFEKTINIWQDAIDNEDNTRKLIKSKSFNFIKIKTILDNPSFAKELCKWILGDLSALLRERNLKYSVSPVSEEKLVQLIYLVKSKSISGKMAKDILQKMAHTGANPFDIISRAGISQISDASILKEIIKNILNKNLDVAKKIRSGNMKPMGFIIGQVMKETNGQANPAIVNKLIEEIIDVPD